jgi:hypothetical protein
MGTVLRRSGGLAGTVMTVFCSDFVGMKTRFVGIVATPAGFEPATPSLEGWMIPLIMLAIFANRVVFDINENSRLRLNCKPKSVHPILRPSPTQPITPRGAAAQRTRHWTCVSADSF